MNIQRIVLTAFLALLICGVSFLNSYAAGQLVTQETRDWAKKTIENEKNIAAAMDKNALLVLYFLNYTNHKELNSLEKGMTLMLLTDLSQVPNLQLVERIKLQALAEELKLGSSGLVDAKTAPRVGKLVGAHWVVGGDFVGKTKQFDTKSRLLNTTTSKVSAHFSVPGTFEEILKTEKELAFDIVKQLNITLEPAVVAAIRKPCSTNLKALDALFRAVDASDRGEYQKAEGLYNEALAADPDVCVAASALQELVRMGGYSNRSSALGMKAKAAAKAEPPKAETAKVAPAKTVASKVTPSKEELSKAESAKSSESAPETFAPASALAETALSVSGRASMTTQFATKSELADKTTHTSPTTPVNIQAVFPAAATTPVTIKVLFP
jgi:TolB-like protein